MSGPDIVVVGAGAAGIGAGRALAAAGASFLVLEARDRVGGRAHTVERAGLPLDLGCGWLHDAAENRCRALFEALGLAVDDSPAPWDRPALDANFPAADQEAFGAAFAAMEERLERAADGPDRPACDLLEPGGRWNALLNAFSAAYNGAAFDRISVVDYGRYRAGDRDVRPAAGYGAGLAHAARDLPVRLGAAVARIAHGGPRVRLHLSDGGVLEARAAVVTLPPGLLLAEAPRFDPPLPGKLEAAAGLPLGFAAKAFLAIAGEADDLAPPDRLLHGATTTTRTASHQLRPLGRPCVESYFGGAFAAEMEAAGPAAMADFAVGQIADALGSSWRGRLSLLAATGWSVDPWSRGAYSHALPGRADARAVLAEPVDDRLFFAGEACSPHAFSTAHGAFETGEAAAAAALAAVAGTRSGRSAGQPAAGPAALSRSSS